MENNLSSEETREFTSFYHLGVKLINFTQKDRSQGQKQEIKHQELLISKINCLSARIRTGAYDQFNQKNRDKLLQYIMEMKSVVTKLEISILRAHSIGSSQNNYNYPFFQNVRSYSCPSVILSNS